MDDIYSLIQSLTSREWESLQNYLTCFSTHASEEGGLKQLQLARILKQETDCPTDVRCCVKIYGVKAEQGFEMLKSRLKEKTLDFLLTDISTDKQHDLDEADLMIIKINKRSAQFRQLFYSKKRTPLAHALLDEIILLAKKYEQYSLLVDHLRLKKVIFVWKQGQKEFDKINAEIESALLCCNTLNKAEHYYYELMMLSSYFGKLDKKNVLHNLKVKIAKVKMGFELTGSPMVHYHLKNLEMGYYELQENYSLSRSVCLELLNIVRNNKSVMRKQRVGVVYDHLSRYEFYIGNSEETVKCAREAQMHFTQGSENYCIALEQEFYALFAMNQYDQSINISNKMITSATRKELGEFRFSKYNYLRANSLFKQRRFQEVKVILAEEREISTDKAGWETGARVLNIMTLVEMLKLDEASLAVLGLKQFFKRADKKTPISKRDKTILNLLLILERAGFMFSTLNGSTEKHLKALSSKEEDLRWEPFTHELIPFHEWFVGKMRVRPMESGGKVKMPKTETAQSGRALPKEKAISQ